MGLAPGLLPRLALLLAAQQLAFATAPGDVSMHSVGWHKGNMVLPDYIVRRGSKSDLPSPRLWPRLLNKLDTPGSNITIVSMGGSVSVGHVTGDKQVSWVTELAESMQSYFPQTTINLVKLARAATASAFASLCQVQEMPKDTDLVVIEYSVNGYRGPCQCPNSSQAAGFELLMRMSMHNAPQAALLTFAAFPWEGGKGIYYDTGEDQQGVLSKYYNVPMLSVRDAFWQAVFWPTSLLRLKLKDFMADRVHPSDYGNKLYAALAVGYVHHRLRLHRHETEHPLTLPTPPPLPPAVNPNAAQEEHFHYCAFGPSLEAAAVERNGFDFVDDNKSVCDSCQKQGWSSDYAGSSITFKINSDVGIPPVMPEDADPKTRVLVVSVSQSTNNRGNATMECISGCKCNVPNVPGHFRVKARKFTTIKYEITAHPECLIRFTVKNRTAESGRPHFKIGLLGVTASDGILDHAYGPVYE